MSYFCSSCWNKDCFSYAEIGVLKVLEKQVSVTYPDRSDRVIDGYTHFYNTAVSIQYKSVYIYIHKRQLQVKTNIRLKDCLIHLWVLMRDIQILFIAWHFIDFTVLHYSFEAGCHNIFWEHIIFDSRSADLPKTSNEHPFPNFNSKINQVPVSYAFSMHELGWIYC